MQSPDAMIHETPQRLPTEVSTQSPGPVDMQNESTENPTPFARGTTRGICTKGVNLFTIPVETQLRCKTSGARPSPFPKNTIAPQFRLKTENGGSGTKMKSVEITIFTKTVGQPQGRLNHYFTIFLFFGPKQASLGGSNA